MDEKQKQEEKMEIRKASGRDLRWMKKTYIEAFPRSERKSFRLMKGKAKQGVMEFLIILEKHQPVGIAITVLHQDLVLLDYFAIHRSCRGKGYGSKALKLLRERYENRRFLLEIELPEEDVPNQAKRLKRKEFYLRNGMQETGIKVCVFQVPMEVLTDGRPFTYEEYHGIYRDSIGTVFARKVTRL